MEVLFTREKKLSTILKYQRGDHKFNIHLKLQKEKKLNEKIKWKN